MPLLKRREVENEFVDRMVMSGGVEAARLTTTIAAR
jgi:hypothetical protein